MAYTNEQIERYLQILNNYTERQAPSANQAVGDEDGDRYVRCWNCQSDQFLC